MVAKTQQQEEGDFSGAAAASLAAASASSSCSSSSSKKGSSSSSSSRRRRFPYSRQELEQGVGEAFLSGSVPDDLFLKLLSAEAWRVGVSPVSFPFAHPFYVSFGLLPSPQLHLSVSLSRFLSPSVSCLFLCVPASRDARCLSLLLAAAVSVAFGVSIWRPLSFLLPPRVCRCLSLSLGLFLSLSLCPLLPSWRAALSLRCRLHALLPQCLPLLLLLLLLDCLLLLLLLRSEEETAYEVSRPLHVFSADEKSLLQHDLHILAAARQRQQQQTDAAAAAETEETLGLSRVQRLVTSYCMRYNCLYTPGKRQTLPAAAAGAAKTEREAREERHRQRQEETLMCFAVACRSRPNGCWRLPSPRLGGDS